MTFHSLLVLLCLAISFSLAGCEGTGGDEDQEIIASNAPVVPDTQPSDNASAWDLLEPYAGNYSGTVSAANGARWNVSLYLHPPYQCYLFIRNDDVSLTGNSPQFSGTTLSFSDDCGVGQNYSVAIRFSTYESGSIHVQKVTGWNDAHYPLSGNIAR
ncbi:MAG: hypothetical protein PHW60_03555 [Kiritimatiellae bacterium]|nr:hypothetical protein [Kiritimatiellia bacterium]